jgi:hypothetical protein
MLRTEFGRYGLPRSFRNPLRARLGLGGQTLRPSGLRSSAWRAMLGRLDRIRSA